MRKIPPFLLLDAWRGLAALWVVMTHACVPFLAAPDNRGFLSFPLYAISMWGQLGVVIFFVISGYCIMGAAYSAAASGRGVGRYLFDRVHRIYPPYFFACLAAVGLDFFIGLGQSHHFLPHSNHPLDHSLWWNPSFWLANLFIVQSEFGQPTLLVIAWSLCYEIVFYAILGVLLVLATLRVLRFQTLGAALVFQIGISVLTFASLAWLIASPVTCPFPVDRWYQFGLGSLLFLVFAAEGESSSWKVRAQLVVACGLLLVFATLHTDPFVLGQPSTRLQAATCLIIVGILCILRPFDAQLAHRRALRPLMWLGTISYSVYLSHPLLMFISDAGGRRLGFDHAWYWVTYFMEIAVSILAGWFFYLLIERRFISSRQKQRIREELNK